MVYFYGSLQISDTFPYSHVLCTLLTKQMFTLAKNNAESKIFVRYADIDNTHNIDKQSILRLFHLRTC